MPKPVVPWTRGTRENAIAEDMFNPHAAYVEPEDHIDADDGVLPQALPQPELVAVSSDIVDLFAEEQERIFSAVPGRAYADEPVEPQGILYGDAHMMVVPHPDPRLAREGITYDVDSGGGAAIENTFGPEDYNPEDFEP
ncbi:hypothetical protein KY359_06830 [Candidatus Woesearchaeota archaeon]|nr:hypothetical protein [Candidatus Woesearchaeota archaeon]